MIARMWVNGVAGTQVSALDRGLSYGDGLFETLRVLDGAAPLWARHMRRLAEGCTRLRLPLPDAEMLWRETAAVSAAMPDAVVRITLTRGVGHRGYAPPAVAAPSRVVAAFAAPVPDRLTYRDGIRVRMCDLRLADQPLLAGIKHLNRLEQVLARAEWDDPAIAEGLLRDTRGDVISATAANVFAVVAGVLRTSAVDRCGVAGVGRAEVLAVRPAAQVGPLGLEALRAASEVFLVSSVRGVVPVQSVAGVRLQPGPVTRQLQQHWHDLGFPPEFAA